MIFHHTDLSGVYLIDLELVEDERGFFGRSFCSTEFAEHGLASSFVQCNISINKQKGLVRGMHFQAPPHAEDKLIRCTAGSVFDVAVDIRPDSKTYLAWVGVELSAANRRMMYIPSGFAHGFQTLEADTELFYQMSECYQPQSGRGFRWNDKDVGIQWPLPVTMVSEKDRNWPTAMQVAKD
jgi:dTDP-4-dehydrorhamnose 3,5-epimerase